MNNRKKISLALASLIAVSSLAACSSGSSSSAPSSTAAPASTASSGAASGTPSSEASSSAQEGPSTVTYPLNSDEKLTVYCNSMNPTGSVTDQSEMWFHNALAERTGVNVEWQFPVSGSNASENLNLMIASDEMPDVMFWNLGSQAQ